MEMHQVRYFLAVARTLNFTRAAEECHVAQPSLTRAIKQLEDEFGGDLFRRERNFTHLTEFGTRMLPLLQQCYDSAASAKKLAVSLRCGAVQPLSVAVSIGVNVMLLIGFLSELTRAFEGLELRFLRGTAAEICEFLKRGDAEVAIAGPIGATWDRLDMWPLFSESMLLAVNIAHPLAVSGEIAVSQLAKERLIRRSFCEISEDVEQRLKDLGLDVGPVHSSGTEQDEIAMLEANLGVGMLPESALRSDQVRRLPLSGFDVTRTISCYSVAGRQRSVPAATLIKMLRAADWADFGISPPAAATVQA